MSFSYDGKRSAVQDVSFTVQPGENVALVGATGSGKSTTLGLLHRAFDPQSGCIRIDGLDIRDVTLSSLRRNIGVVFQEPMLFARSIRENLQVGRPDATDAEMIEALERAQAIEFIARQTDGLDTVIGERGRSLSGGERQRLSIARALLKNPPILILDEATSALDAATERKLQMALDEVMKGRTTFVIAHRLATIRNADRILVFDQGRVIESGTFDELVAKGGRFAELAKAQFMAAEEPPKRPCQGVGARMTPEPSSPNHALGVRHRANGITLHCRRGRAGGRSARHPAARLSGVLVGLAPPDRAAGRGRLSGARAGSARLQSQRQAARAGAPTISTSWRRTSSAWPMLSGGQSFRLVGHDWGGLVGLVDGLPPSGPRSSGSRSSMRRIPNVAGAYMRSPSEPDDAQPLCRVLPAPLAARGRALGRRLSQRCGRRSGAASRPRHLLG